MFRTFFISSLALLLVGCGPEIALVRPVGNEIVTSPTPNIFKTLDHTLPATTTIPAVKKSPLLPTEPVEVHAIPFDAHAQLTLHVQRTPTFSLTAAFDAVVPLPPEQIYALWLVRIDPLDYQHVVTFTYDTEARVYRAAFASTEDWSEYTRAVVTRQPPGHRLQFSARYIVREIALTDF